MKKSKAVALTVCSGIFALSVSALIGINAATLSAGAEEETTWKMAAGAAVRVSTPAGIRFTAQVSEKEYEEELSDTETREVKFGMVIMPYEYVEKYGEISEDTLFGDSNKRKYWWNEENKDPNLTQVLHYEVDDLQTVKDGNYLFNCAMTDIKTANYEREFYARAYYSVTVDDTTTYQFTTVNGTENVRSVSYVAQKALDDSADKTSVNYGKYKNHVTTLAKYGCKVGYTLRASDGAEVDNTNRIACTQYLTIEEIQSVSVNGNYLLTWLAYGADKTYIGNGNAGSGNWLAAGETITPATILNSSDDSGADYSKAVYFRFAVKAAEDRAMTEKDLDDFALTITSQPTFRSEVSLNGVTVSGTEGEWTESENTVTSVGSGQEIKYFAQTGSVYSVEATLVLENNQIPTDDQGNPWTDAGIVICGENNAQYAFMMFLKSDGVNYGMWLVDLNTWIVKENEWLGAWTLTQAEDGTTVYPTIKIVNDGTQITLYKDGVVLFTLTADAYPDLVGKNNAVGFITIDDSATFRDYSIIFQEQRTAEGTLSVSDGLGIVYNLDKTTVYAETAEGETVTLENAVNARGEFTATIPTDTVKLTFDNDAFLPKTYDLPTDNTDSVKGISVKFDRVAVRSSVALDGVTQTAKSAGYSSGDYTWTKDETSMTSGSAAREVKFFAQSADKYIVETTVSGWETNYHSAGIVFGTADCYYAYTVMPYNGTHATPMFLQLTPSYGAAWWNSYYEVEVAASYKLSIVNDGTYMWFYLNDTLVTYIQATSKLTLYSDNDNVPREITADFVGKEQAIGLVSIDKSAKTFTDFSLDLNELGLTVMVINTTETDLGQISPDISTTPKHRFISTAEYLRIDKVKEVSFDTKYKLQWFAYDANYNCLGRLVSAAGKNTYITDGSFAPSEILSLEEYKEAAVYFRFRLGKTESLSTLSAADIAAANVVVTPNTAESEAYTYIGEPVGGSFTNTLTYKQVTDLITDNTMIQDGAVCGNYIFSFVSDGTCNVYSKTDYTKVGSFSLAAESSDTVTPHSNSVCFGTAYYEDGDEFPLLYSNVYNNSDAHKGVCNVYRITREGTTFTSTLVQVIKLGFIEDLTCWTAGVRPYGNFVVDGENNKLYCYVMVDETNVTRFFEFALPTLADGEVVTLSTDKIVNRFDTAYFGYMQGVCIHDGKIYSLEGSPERNCENVLRVIDPATQKEISRINLTEIGIAEEPEMIFVENGTLYIATVHGALYEVLFY